MCLVAESFSTLCNPMDCSPSGSSVHGILQARILEWIAMSSSGDLPNPGIKPRYPSLQADSLPGKPIHQDYTPSLGLGFDVFQLICSYFKANNVHSLFGKLSSSHRTGKDQFSFQSQRKAMPKNAQTTTQLHLSHTLTK